MNRSLARQRGFGWLGNLLFIILVGSVVLSVLKIGPYYYEFYKVRGSVEALKKRDDLGPMTPEQIRKALTQQLYMDQVDELLKPDNIKIRRSADQIQIEVKYEVRDHLVGNIDFILNFEHSLRLKVS